MRQYFSTNLFLSLLSCSLIGCATSDLNIAYPTTTVSFHEPDDSGKRFSIFVWGNHPVVVTAAIDAVKNSRNKLAKSRRGYEIFKANPLAYTSDAEQILKVGKLLGADRVIVAERASSSSSVSVTRRNPYSGAPQGRGSSDKFYSQNVTITCVDVESGKTVWAVTAGYLRLDARTDSELANLTRLGMERGFCPIGSGYEWIEMGPEGGGCRQKK